VCPLRERSSLSHVHVICVVLAFQQGLQAASVIKGRIRKSHFSASKQLLSPLRGLAIRQNRYTVMRQPRGRAPRGQIEWSQNLVPGFVINIKFRIAYGNCSQTPSQLSTAFSALATGDENPWSKAFLFCFVFCMQAGRWRSPGKRWLGHTHMWRGGTNEDRDQGRRCKELDESMHGTDGVKVDDAVRRNIISNMRSDA
jgi:hypothetical protein